MLFLAEFWPSHRRVSFCCQRPSMMALIVRIKVAFGDGDSFAVTIGFIFGHGEGMSMMAITAECDDMDKSRFILIYQTAKIK